MADLVGAAVSGEFRVVKSFLGQTVEKSPETRNCLKTTGFSIVMSI